MTVRIVRWVMRSRLSNGRAARYGNLSTNGRAAVVTDATQSEQDMRAVVGSVAVLVLTGLAAHTNAADEKVDVKKLIGRWEPVAPGKDLALVLDIAENGKIAMYVTSDGKTRKVEGTYTVKDDKIEVELTYNGNTRKDTLTVLKLTDTELVTRGKSGAEETMKRVKEKDEKKEKDKEK